MKLKEKLFVSSSPHIRDTDSVPKVMWTVVIALMPVFIASTIFFGFDAVRCVFISIVSCMLCEHVFQKLLGRESTVDDGSAAVTGALLAFCLPPTVSWWLIVVGAFFAIFVSKLIFGGVGHNIFNPAHAARAVLLAAFPLSMTTWVGPFDSVTTATPLAIVKENLSVQMPSYMDLFLGNVSGSLGETSALAILIGGGIMVYRGVIDWEMPFFHILTVFVLSYLLGRDGLYEILAGGCMLGGVFMITDMVTKPITKAGSIIFAVGAGIILVVIRIFGGYPEGSCYATLIMNGFTPIIDRYLKPRQLGLPL